MSASSFATTLTSKNEGRPQKITKKPEHPVDARLRHINDKVLPAAPYILSTDRSLEKHYIRHTYPNSANTWRKHTLFDHTEERLQYLTFKDRSNDSSVSGMYARGGWEDGKGGLAAREEPVSRTSSDGTPRPGQGPKKKITLADYKNKERNKGMSTTTRPEIKEAKEDAMANGKQLGLMRVDKEAIKKANKVEKIEQHGQKRPADTMTGLKDPQAFDHPPITPSAKKARVEGEPSFVATKEPPTVAPKTTTRQIPCAVKTEVHPLPFHKLNAEKSATTESPSTKSKALKIEKPAMATLPPMLSPLASDIEEELAKLGQPAQARSHSATSTKGSSVSPVVKQSKTNHGDTTSSGEKSKPKRVLSTAPSTSTKGPQEQKLVTSAPRQGVEDLSLTKVTSAKPISKGLTNGSREDATHTPKSTAAAEPSKKLRLRVTLKIKKKSHRKTLSQYLRMKPTPGKYPWGIQKNTRAEGAKPEVKPDRVIQVEEKVITKRNNLEPTKSGEKRRRALSSEDEPEPPTKRTKAPGLLPSKPRTPKQSSISSPALSHLGSAQKPHLSAPEIEPRSTPMMRGPSGDGSVHTPHQPTFNGTPNAADTINSHKSVNTSGGLKPKSDDLRAEVRTYMGLAKSLKYDADRFFKKPHGMTEDERKQGVIIGIETVICFMLGFTLDDVCRNSGDRAGWHSILGYMVKVTEEAKGFRSLTGLIYQLEAVIRDVLVYKDLQRLNQDPLGDQFVNAATADPAKTGDQNRAAEYHRQYAELHRQCNKARNAWHTGLTYLNNGDIASKFPKTWAKRDQQHVSSGKGNEAIKKGEYVRSFALPLGYMSSSLEAVNFGLSILGELCHNEGTEWKPKLLL